MAIDIEQLERASARRREKCRRCLNEPACGHWLEPRFTKDEDGDEVCEDFDERPYNPFA